jgi:alpha-amylase
VGSNGTVEVEYTKGGVPAILVPDNILQGCGICHIEDEGQTAKALTNGGGRRVSVPIASLFLGGLVRLVLVSLLM